MSLHVLRPGLLTTVQDLGRRGHQREGVPVGGAMDAVSLRLANLAAGNPPGAAALEITLAGPTLRFAEDALVALAGAELPAELDGQPIPDWRPVRVPAGATLALGRATSGARAYLAVAGGIAVPPVLGSRSTYLGAGFGGLDGRALRASDVLPVGEPCALARRIRATLGAEGEAAAPWSVAASLRPPVGVTPTIRLTPGTHADALTAESRSALLGAEFRVSPRSDRMGYRLAGPTLRLSEPIELVSEAVAEGTVQLPPGGEPIVLMADRQTTGGYPRIAQVATVDLPLLAQLRPGEAVRFREIPLAESQALYLARERELTMLEIAIRLRYT